MGTLPRHILLEKIIGYVIVHDKVYLAYPDDDNKEWHEIVLVLAVENQQDKTELLALADIFLQGFRSGMIRRETGCLPQFDGDASSKQKKSLQVLLQHIMDNQNDRFARIVVEPLAKKYSLAKPKYMTISEIKAMAVKLGMKSI